MKCVGGPFDGHEVGWTTDVVTFDDDDFDRDMAYHRTRPTDTDWRDDWADDAWWVRGLPEPTIPARVYEWHERGWMSPEVAHIRGMLIEAADRLR